MILRKERLHGEACGGDQYPFGNLCGSDESPNEEVAWTGFISPTIQGRFSLITDKQLASTLQNNNRVPFVDKHKRQKDQVRTMEGETLNNHMFSWKMPGLPLSALRTLDAPVLEAKQPGICCLDGFALNFFPAQKSMGTNVKAENIKALLLHTAGYQASVCQGKLMNAHL